MVGWAADSGHRTGSAVRASPRHRGPRSDEPVRGWRLSVAILPGRRDFARSERTRGDISLGRKKQAWEYRRQRRLPGNGPESARTLPGNRVPDLVPSRRQKRRHPRQSIPYARRRRVDIEPHTSWFHSLSSVMAGTIAGGCRTMARTPDIHRPPACPGAGPLQVYDGMCASRSLARIPDRSPFIQAPRHCRHAYGSDLPIQGS